MATVVVTADALELMERLTGVTKKMAEAVKEVSGRLDDARAQAIEPDFYTTEQISKKTGIAVATLRRYQSEGAIGGRTPMPPSVVFGTKRMYPREDYAEWKKKYPRDRRGAKV